MDGTDEMEQEGRDMALRRILVAGTLAAVLVVLTPGVSAAVTPSAPTGLTAVAGDKKVTLSWTASSNSPTDYIVEYSLHEFIAGYPILTFVKSTSTTTSATVTGLTNGTTYTFRVKGTNSSGTSAASSTASATPVANNTPNDLAIFKACPTGVAPAHGFSDVVASVTSTAVSCIKYYEITKGTTTTTYSPGDSVPRWQMALFLTRMAVPAGAALGDGSDQGFTDISGKSAEIQTAINQLKQLGITVGTDAAGILFNPDGIVTREEMALFISRLLKNATTGPGGNEEFVSGSTGAKEVKSIDPDYNFTDIEDINLTETRTAVISLWNLGVTDDSTATTYRPSDPMTRAAMAQFMAAALDHANARPKGLTMQADSYLAEADFLVTLSVTYRTDGFLPIANALVDTFKYKHVTTTGHSDFSSDGSCAQVVVTSVALTRCYIDTAEPSTDTDGNVASFTEGIANETTWDVWAWTGASTTAYDNDVHATDASKITIISY